MQSIHLKAPSNWINDPNGFIYYKGKYHLFYQHFPYAPRWGTMHWGHAVSEDLVNWEHKGIALFPSKYNDRNGCFSGSAIESEGKMYIYYTGVRYLEQDPEDIHLCLNDKFVSSQMMITSEDGEVFDNIKDKSTIIPPLEEPCIGCRTHTRDPKVWRGNDGRYYMVLGSRTPQNEGKLLFYRSDDMHSWEYVNSASKPELGWMWECPDYFEADGEKVLIFSPMSVLKDGKEYQNISLCALVDFNESDCEMKLPEEYQQLDYGQDLYAPQSTTDSEGRRVIVEWARMPEAVDGKWNGMFCIPRVVEVRNGHICFKVHPNIEAKFTREISSVYEASADGYRISVDIQDGESLDIGGYRIWRDGSKICTDRSKVFRNHNDIRTNFATPEIEGDIHLDIYVDKNLIEVYINDGEYVISNVVYDLDNYLISKTDSELKISTTV